jgi:hypothetical protein
MSKDHTPSLSKNNGSTLIKGMIKRGCKKQQHTQMRRVKSTIALETSSPKEGEIAGQQSEILLIRKEGTLDNMKTSTMLKCYS